MKVDRTVEYRAWLARLGYDPHGSKDHFVVRVVEDNYENAFFNGQEFIIGGKLVHDPVFTLLQYTEYVLNQTNPLAFRSFL